MMRILQLFILLIIVQTSWGQTKEINPSMIYKQRVAKMQCLDTNGVVSIYCPLSLYSFKVVIYKSVLNKADQELSLIGRICGGNESNCTGLYGIEIFLGERDEKNKVNNKEVIGETAKDTNGFNNGGFFDVKIKVRKNTSLFFFNSAFGLAEYKLWPLLK